MNTNLENNAINFSKLETLFNTKILFLSHHDFIKNVKNVTKMIADQPINEPVALLIQTDHKQSTIKRLGLFLYTSIQFKYLKFRISKIPAVSIKPYGVYPKIENPFAIYQLGTPAENYTNSNILPVRKKNVKGLISKVLAFISNYHASTAGIVLLIVKKS